MTDHDTLERIARQLCTDAGRDYDRKGCKRNHWRSKAQLLLACAKNRRGPAMAWWLL